MNAPRKILLIDKTADRKQRIGALKARGYAVFPALKLEEARSRCMGGSYDLILVNPGEDEQQALQFCDELKAQCPKQLVLMSTDADIKRDFRVAADTPTLLDQVDKMLRAESNPSDYASAA